MAERKSVLMLLSNPFRPDPRVHREATALVRAGYGVTIICWDRDRKHPLAETVDGINIIRVGPKAGWGNARSMLKGLPVFWKNLRKAASGIDYDIIHAHDLDTLSPGLRLAAKNKVPILYDGHEIYHEMAGENLSPTLTKLVARYERHMLKKPDAVITVNEPIAELFRGYGARDVRVVMNCQPDVKVEEATAEALRGKLSPRGKKMALYLGVLEPNRLILELAEAHAAGREDFLLVIGGFGTLEARVKDIATGSRVAFIGKIHPRDMPVYNRAADVLLATYDPGLRNNRLGAPNKLFEAMMASRPIIVSKGTYAARVVERTGCGLASDYDSGPILSTASRLMNDGALHGRCASAGRAAYESEYNWTVMESRLLALYSELLR